MFNPCPPEKKAKLRKTCFPGKKRSSSGINQINWKDMSLSSVHPRVDRGEVVIAHAHFSRFLRRVWGEKEKFQNCCCCCVFSDAFEAGSFSQKTRPTPTDAPRKTGKARNSVWCIRPEQMQPAEQQQLILTSLVTTTTMVMMKNELNICTAMGCILSSPWMREGYIRFRSP